MSSVAETWLPFLLSDALTAFLSTEQSFSPIRSLLRSFSLEEVWSLSVGAVTSLGLCASSCDIPSGLILRLHRGEGVATGDPTSLSMSFPVVVSLVGITGVKARLLAVALVIVDGAGRPFLCKGEVFV